MAKFHSDGPVCMIYQNLLACVQSVHLSNYSKMFTRVVRKWTSSHQLCLNISYFGSLRGHCLLFYSTCCFPLGTRSVDHISGLSSKTGKYLKCGRDAENNFRRTRCRSSDTSGQKFMEFSSAGCRTNVILTTRSYCNSE